MPDVRGGGVLWISNLADTSEGNHNADAAQNKIEFDTPTV